MPTTDWYPRYVTRFYLSRPGYVDGQTEFHSMCRAALRLGGRYLEVGAGPGNDTSAFLAALGELDGVDIDPDVRTNPYLANAHVLDGERYPYPDACFDGVVSNYVLEHVEDPRGHLTEIARVLRPGGCYLFRTPNLLHYVAAFSAVTPHSVHSAIANRLRRLPPDAHEPYPTFYRLNTRKAVERHAAAVGLSVEELRFVEKEPVYGRASRALYLPFMVYERLVNSTDALARFRSNIFGVLRRPI